MITIKVTCDKCSRDLTKSGPLDEWRLKLSAEKLPNNMSHSYGQPVTPPLERTMHFCDANCLNGWLHER